MRRSDPLVWDQRSFEHNAVANDEGHRASERLIQLLYNNDNNKYNIDNSDNQCDNIYSQEFARAGVVHSTKLVGDCIRRSAVCDRGIRCDRLGALRLEFHSR